MEIREFIRNLGDKAPEIFDTSDKTIARWLKTGSIPMKAAQKAFTIMQAMDGARSFQEAKPDVAPNFVANIDPLTNLPRDLDRRLPTIQGQPPSEIEINPAEQSFGNNLTRPGRMSSTPMKPMLIKKVDGVDVAYTPEQPKPPSIISPTIPQGAGAWSKPFEVKTIDNRTPEQKASGVILKDEPRPTEPKV